MELSKNFRLLIIFGFAYSLLLTGNAAGIIHWLPPCLIRHYTGYECLGCGLNRSLVAFLQGNITGAIELNPLIIFVLPLILFLMVHLFRKSKNLTYDH